MFIIQILRKLFTWNISPKGDSLSADAIICHAAGESLEKTGGLVNNMLADVIFEIQSRQSKELPIIAQAEVANIIEARGIFILARSKSQKDSLQHLSTHDIALWSQDVCRLHRFKRVILVSHQGHLPRVYYVTHRECPYFTHLIIPDIPRGIYDTQNSQIRWRSFFTAWPYEMMIRIVYLFKRVM